MQLIAKLKKNEIKHSKTGYGDQGCRPLGARSTISDALEFLYSVAHGIAETISSKTHFKSFCQAFFKKPRFPFYWRFAIG